ncbi:MAG: protein translocase subunit SecD [Candidatus Paceibacterota bacterium]|jgi:preprotein translocase subunit SecD
MSKKITVLSLLFIIILTAVAGFFCFPRYLNQGIKWADEKTGWKIAQVPESGFRMGLDLKGGVRLEYQADLSNVAAADRTEAMAGLKDVIERRVNTFGVAEPQITVSGENRLMVELPGIDNIDEAKQWIGQTPWLQFLEERSEEETQQIIDSLKKLQGKKGDELIQDPDFLSLLDENGNIKNAYYKTTELDSRYFKKAVLSYSQTGSQPEIDIEFNADGAKIFEQVTERNVGKTLAIFLDGKSIIDVGEGGIYAPKVLNKISDGKAVITGEESAETARTIVSRLNQGALPVKIGSPISESKIGPTLGMVSLNDTLKAGLIGLLLIVIFMVVYYRLPGLLASIALVFYGFLLLAIFKLISVTLTLAGIGGVILSIGMAIDANVLIFTRMKEELSNGKNFGQSVEEGFSRAWPAIRDGNATTLLVGFILLFLGTSFVKGFATTLNIGILLSMFSAIIVTRSMLRLFVGTKLEKITWLWK